MKIQKILLVNTLSSTRFHLTNKAVNWKYVNYLFLPFFLESFLIVMWPFTIVLCYHTVWVHILTLYLLVLKLKFELYLSYTKKFIIINYFLPSQKFLHDHVNVNDSRNEQTCHQIMSDITISSHFSEPINEAHISNFSASNDFSTELLQTYSHIFNDIYLCLNQISECIWINYKK